MHSLAQSVLSHIRSQELLHAGNRVGVAVSGGIDSVTLLRLLLELRGELGLVLSVVHFNHKLRGAESEADEKFVAALARAHGLEFLCDSDDVARQAAEDHVSVETAARDLRYGFFRSLIEEGISGAEAQSSDEYADRGAESSAAAKGGSQGLKPDSNNPPLRGAEAPLFHSDVNQGDLNDAAGSCAVSKLDKIATGHTLDDQAETVLMRMIRGAGLKGLGGIHPRIAVEDDDGEICGEIVRPLLAFRRRELEHYLREIGQNWREDSSNTDTSYTRNRVRQLLVPLLEREFNPAVAENLAELAEIARGEEDYWDNEVAGWMGTAVHWSEPEWARSTRSQASLVQIVGSHQGLKPKSMATSDGTAEAVPFPNPDSLSNVDETSSIYGSRAVNRNETKVVGLPERIDSAPWLVLNASVDRLWFLGESAAVQRRLVKAIGEQAGIPLEFKHVEEVLNFATEDRPPGKHLSLPLGWQLVREPDELVFLTPDLREQTEPQDYEYKLSIPGQVTVLEAGFTLQAQCVPAASLPEQNPAHLLDASSLTGPMTLRNWRPGDRFWPPHTKSPKKIKELLQERHIPQPERKLWPVLASGNEIVWMRGFEIPTKFQAKPGHDAVLVIETLHP